MHGCIQWLPARCATLEHVPFPHLACRLHRVTCGDGAESALFPDLVCLAKWSVCRLEQFKLGEFVEFH